MILYFCDLVNENNVLSSSIESKVSYEIDLYCSEYYQRKSFGFSPEEPDARRSVLESAQYQSQGHRPSVHPSFVNSRMPQNASLVPLINEPIRVNVFSFVIHKMWNSQYPEQSKLF